VFFPVSAPTWVIARLSVTATANPIFAGAHPHDYHPKPEALKISFPNITLGNQRAVPNQCYFQEKKSLGS
jgi:hypothetical protein